MGQFAGLLLIMLGNLDPAGTSAGKAEFVGWMES